jgi:hypothetical protein
VRFESARAVAFVVVAVLAVDAFAADDRIVLRRAHPIALYWDEAHFEEGQYVPVTMWESVKELQKTLFPHAFVFACAGRRRQHDPIELFVDLAPAPNSSGALYLAASVKKGSWDAFLADVRAEIATVTPDTCAEFIRRFPLRFLEPDPPIAGAVRGAICVEIAGRADEAFEIRTEKLDNGGTKIKLVVTGQSQRTCEELSNELDRVLRRGTPRIRSIDIQEEVEETLALRTRANLEGSPVGTGPVSVASLDGRAVFSRWTSRTRTFRLGADPQMTAEDVSVLNVAHLLPESQAPVDFDRFARAVAAAMESSREPVGVSLLTRALRENDTKLPEGSVSVLCDPAKPAEASQCAATSCTVVENARDVCASLRSRLD